MGRIEPCVDQVVRLSSWNEWDFDKGLWTVPKANSKKAERTLATRLNDLGIPPHVVEHLLGHSVSGVAGIYNRGHYINEKKVALDKWLDEIQGEAVLGSEKALL